MLSSSLHCENIALFVNQSSLFIILVPLCSTNYLVESTLIELGFQVINTWNLAMLPDMTG